MLSFCLFFTLSLLFYLHPPPFLTPLILFFFCHSFLFIVSLFFTPLQGSPFLISPHSIFFDFQSKSMGEAQASTDSPPASQAIFSNLPPPSPYPIDFWCASTPMPLIIFAIHTPHPLPHITPRLPPHTHARCGNLQKV